jgi:hypothetical protein
MVRLFDSTFVLCTVACAATAALGGLIGVKWLIATTMAAVAR